MEPQRTGRRDLFLLLSILLAIVAQPLLAPTVLGKVLEGVLTFVPLVLAASKMAQRREVVWPFVPLLLGALVCFAMGLWLRSPILFAVQWGLLTLAFALSVAGLFAYLLQAQTVTAGHLCTACSIYLLLGLGWYTGYQAIEAVCPGSFRYGVGGDALQHPAELLYFSLVTLTTLGYGDIVPVLGVARMVAALEAAAGVLYVAITVAVLVSAYRRGSQG